MKVGLVMPTNFDPSSVMGGGERYALELARALAKRVDTTLVTFGPEAKVVRHGELTIDYRRVHFSAGGVINPVVFSHLGVLEACDVIHCLQPRTIVTDLAMLFGKLRGKKTFLTDLSGGAPITPSRLVPMANMMSGFLPISEFSRSRNPWITKPVTVIYGGVDAELFTPDAAATKARDLFVYVGRIFPGKGLHVLLDALPPGARLDVIGAHSTDEYRRQVEAQAQGKAVTFLGAVSDAGVIHKYRESLASVLPSLVDTGFTSSMESMACGTPVIGTRLGSLPEVVTDGTNGLLVPPDDVAALRAGLERALHEADRLIAMAKTCRETVLERFTWDKVAERCVAAYSA